jgi:hypothetical protein
VEENAMTVKIELEYKYKPPKEVTVEVVSKLKGSTLLDKIDKAVRKTYADDPDWTRWSLKNISD